MCNGLWLPRTTCDQSGPSIGDTDQWEAGTWVMTMNGPRQICPHSALLRYPDIWDKGASLNTDTEMRDLLQKTLQIQMFWFPENVDTFSVPPGLTKTNTEHRPINKALCSQLRPEYDDTDWTISSELIEFVSAGRQAKLIHFILWNGN